MRSIAAQRELDPGQVLNAVAGAPLEKVLQERGSRYGTFQDHANITQTLKAIFKSKMGARWDALQDDQKEALEMIAHKLGRVLNGDPNYADSWVDIAGYAQLVADRLNGTVR